MIKKIHAKKNLAICCSSEEVIFQDWVARTPSPLSSKYFMTELPESTEKI